MMTCWVGWLGPSPPGAALGPLLWGDIKGPQELQGLLAAQMGLVGDRWQALSDILRVLVMASAEHVRDGGKNKQELGVPLTVHSFNIDQSPCLNLSSPIHSPLTPHDTCPPISSSSAWQICTHLPTWPHTLPQASFKLPPIFETNSPLPNLLLSSPSSGSHPQCDGKTHDSLVNVGHRCTQRHRF